MNVYIYPGLRNSIKKNFKLKIKDSKAEKKRQKKTLKTKMLNDILEFVCSKFDISPNVIKSRSRIRPVAECRMIFYKLVRDLYEDKFSLSELGEFTNRDHTTVLYGIRNVENMHELNYIYKNNISDLEKDKLYVRI